MLNDKKVFALIPARGGSTRLPGKNVKLLNGKPLIAYSIEEARKSQYIDRVVVSTDSEAIADVAKSYKAEIPFLRPSSISGKYALPHSYITHFYDHLKANGDNLPDITVLLQPTSPLRTFEDIDRSLELLEKEDTEQVLSVYVPDKKPSWYRTVNNEGYLIEYPELFRLNSDSLCYLLNGAIYAFKTVCFKDNKGVIATKTVPYEMPPERSVDIDRDIDFDLAELLLKRAQNC